MFKNMFLQKNVILGEIQKQPIQLVLRESPSLEDLPVGLSAWGQDF